MKERNVVIVEKDTDTLFIMKQVLEGYGYHVKTLTEGKGILEEDFSAPDLFILGKDLPTIDGIALCKFLKIQRSMRHVPVIMISAHPTQEKAYRAGVDIYLPKPLHVSMLLQAVHECLPQNQMKKLG